MKYKRHNTSRLGHIHSAGFLPVRYLFIMIVNYIFFKAMMLLLMASE